MAVVEGVAESFLTTRHPRTAIGWNSDQSLVWMVVVDGRQEHSVGMSLQELSTFFLKLGASVALNLDGGGSSTIVAKGKVLNSPSDPTGERRVTNALLLIKD
jgi:exopolysaccharide biosynthesis protein